MAVATSETDRRRISAAVDALGRRKTFTHGEFIFTEGDSSHHVYTLIDGQIRIIRALRSGRQLLLETHGPGSEFGELSALDGAPRAASAVAHTSCIVSRLSGERFNRLLCTDAELSAAVSRWLAAQLRATNERLRARNAESTVARAGHQLIEQATLRAKLGGALGRIELALTQQDLAEWIGATREATARSLATLRSRGLVETSRGRIVVVDVAALATALDTS